MMRLYAERSSGPARTAGFLATAFKAYAQRLVLWRTRQALLQLNDHMLRDIGLTREDITLGRFTSLMDD
jgi:uncharacterized protein YjiS (DUF1127 family)